VRKLPAAQTSNGAGEQSYGYSKMLKNGLKAAVAKTRFEVLTVDKEFERSLHNAFAPGGTIDLDLVVGTISASEQALGGAGVTVAVIDIDAHDDEEMAALNRLATRLGGWPPIVAVVPSFDKDVARRLMQMRIADFLVKPVQPLELVRTCARVVQAPKGADRTEAEIYTYIPAIGGAGVTTLAIQTALILLGSGEHKAHPATCLVDLDFQHGACAHYLDLEPRLDLKEIEPRPERLDRQLLEVMLSYHASGLAVVAAPNRPAEMRTFDPEMVTRLLDLVSANFKYVVIDMPRTWFPWTDSVLLGSNQLYVVCEMTVPGIKHAKQLVSAIKERLEAGAQPKVIVNRFEQSLFGPGVRRNDLIHAFGTDLAAVIPNHYRLVREAIDRGVPLDEVRSGSKITQELKKLIASTRKPGSNSASDSTEPRRKLNVSLAQ
jgi:pilus assembly protein CpaE